MIQRKVRAGSAEKQKKKAEGYNQSAGCGKEFGPALLATAHKESVAFMAVSYTFPLSWTFWLQLIRIRAQMGKMKKKKEICSLQPNKLIWDSV